MVENNYSNWGDQSKEEPIIYDENARAPNRKYVRRISLTDIEEATRIHNLLMVERRRGEQD